MSKILRAIEQTRKDMTLKDNNNGTFSVVAPCSFKKKGNAYELADEIKNQLKELPQLKPSKWDSFLIDVESMLRQQAKRIEELEAQNDALNLELGNPIDFDNWAKHQKVSDKSNEVKASRGGE